MATKSRNSQERPHTSRGDYLEGSLAAERFRGTLTHLISIAPAIVPRPHATPRAKPRRGKNKPSILPVPPPYLLTASSI